MIPSSSQVLIIGAEPISLILGVALSKAGLEVLIAEEKSETNIPEEEVLLSSTELDFLKFLGFQSGEPQSLSLKGIERQALQLLGTHLGSIRWTAKSRDIEPLSGKVALKIEHKGNVFIHHTSLIVKQGDLQTTLSFPADLKNVELLFWKIESYLKGLLTASVLNQHQEEKNIIVNYYAEDDLSKSIFHRLFDKILKVEKGAFSLKESAINVHLSQYRNINAGDLLPNWKLFDEKLKKEISIYDWCKYGRFSVILIGDLASYNLNKYAHWLKTNYKIDVFYLPFSEKNKALFKFLEIPEGEKRTLIIRPDRFIGFVNDRVELEIIENYLNNVLMMYPNPQAFSARGLTEGEHKTTIR